MNSTAAVRQPQQVGSKPSRYGLSTQFLVLAALLAVTFGAVFTTAEKSQPFGDTLATVVENVSPLEAETANAHTTMLEGHAFQLYWNTGKLSTGEGYLWLHHPYSGSPEHFQISSWHDDTYSPDQMYAVAAKAQFTKGSPSYEFYTTGWDIGWGYDNWTSMILSVNGQNGMFSAASWWQAWRNNSNYWDPVQAFCFKPGGWPYYSHMGFC